MLQAVYNKMIVELIKEDDEKMSPTGLLHLPSKNTPYYRGKVISVGEGHYQNAKRIPMDIKKGDIVVFLQNSGLAIELDATNTPTKLVLADTDIYAIEKEDE